MVGEKGKRALELVLKAEIMGPMGAIVSATKTNAEMIGLSGQLGTLESGKCADLIVADGNPLKDMTLFEKGLEKIVLVMKSGRIMKNKISDHRQRVAPSRNLPHATGSAGDR